MNRKLLYVSLCSLSWALNIVLGRYLLNLGIKPLTLNVQTLLIATIFILAYLIYTNPKSITHGSKSSHTGAAISGIIGGGLANIFALQGLQLSTATNYGFLVKTSAAFNVLLAFLLIKEPINKLKGILLVVMLAGAYLLSTNGKLITPHFGDIFILLAAFGYGLASVLNRKVLKKGMNPDVVSLYRAGLGFVVTFIAAHLFGQLSFASPALLLTVTNGLLGALIYIFLNKTLQVASSSYLGMMSMSVPVIVALIAVPLFGDKLSLVQWLGGSMIVLGGVLTEVKKVAQHD